MSSNLNDAEESRRYPYVDTKNYTPPVLYDDLKRICSSILDFISNEPNDKTKNYSDTENQSWCSNPNVVYNALICQKERASSRYECLQKLFCQLSERSMSPTVLCCIQQQLLEGCFGFCNIKQEDSTKQMHHYLDNILAAPTEIQEKIRIVIHGIYESLIKTLKNLVATNSDSKHIVLVLIFALSSKFDANDLTVIINNDLVQLLIQVINVNTISTKLVCRNEFLGIAALRLVHVITMCCCLHSKKVGLDTLENVLNILHEQFIKSMEDFDKSCQSAPHLTFTDSFATEGDRYLGDFLLFLRTISSSVIIQKLFASKKWIYAFLAILETSNACVSYHSQMKILRPKLLIIQLLQIILPSLQSVHIDDDLRKHIINKLLSQISKEMWNEGTNCVQAPLHENSVNDDIEEELLDNYKGK